ncbi:MAG: 2'-5' RNA ligase family protein [Proteobacteria bacterium]|nr:2'-5' RNA ligase family protein [Pseudomonadota bacterium]
MNGIFIVAELEGPIAARIHALQERFDPKLAAELPPHVTVLGSSGAGPIDPDTSVADLRAAIEPIAAATPPLTLRFGAPMRFLQREIVSLPLDPHGPLRTLHEALKSSGLRCAVARYPFTPHCTLNFYRTITPESLREMLAVREREPWTLHRLRVYHTRDPQPPRHLFDVTLTG